MPRKSIVLSLSLCVAVLFFACDGKKTTQLKPGEAWGQLGAHTFDSLQFQQGTGSFEGTSIAVVGQDEKTGAMAAFVKLPPTKLESRSLHYHTSAAHNLVLEGSVKSIIDGQEKILGEGDYFRTPANLAHVSSGSDEGALIFMITDGRFESVALEDAAQAPAAVLPWGKTGIQRMAEVNFAAGEGSFSGTRVAILGKDEATGKVAAFVDLPPTELNRSLHYHTAAAHSLILKGTVTGIMDDKLQKLGRFDYFRIAANQPHASSGSDAGAMIFMVTDGQFDIKSVQ